MLPSLAPQDLSDPVAVRVPPPDGFRPLAGQPREVYQIGRWTWGGKESLSDAQRNGLRYEDRVQRMLAEWNPEYHASQGFSFVDNSGRRRIVPDGFLWGRDRIFIFEIKIRHMPEAYWQLLGLYRPVLQYRHPRHKVVCVEVCGSYDPTMPFPHPHDMVTMEELADYRGDLGVVVWTPK